MKKANGNNGYQTVGQAAKAIGVSRQAINQMIHDGRLHAIWMLEQWAIHEVEIQRVKEQRESEQAA